MEEKSEKNAVGHVSYRRRSTAEFITRAEITRDEGKDLQLSGGVTQK